MTPFYSDRRHKVQLFGITYAVFVYKKLGFITET